MAQIEKDAWYTRFALFPTLVGTSNEKSVRVWLEQYEERSDNPTGSPSAFERIERRPLDPSKYSNFENYSKVEFLEDSF